MLHEHTLTALRDMLRRREISSTELTQHCLDRIAKHSDLNAFVTLDESGAMAAAAVADFRPKKSDNKKIKKESQFDTLKLEPTQDILAWMGVNKNHQFLLGFALETDNETENAIKKLKSKNLDAIVLNSLKDDGAGFSGDTNKISYIDKNEKIIHFDLKLKDHVAEDIFTQIIWKHAEILLFTNFYFN